MIGISEQTLALLSLAFSAFTSATLLPGTSEAVLAALAAAGTAPTWILVVVATSANVAGSCVNWAMGRFAGRLGRYWVSRPSRSLDRAERWFNKWGKWSLLASWVPVVGDPLTLIAGVLRVPFPAFVAIVSVAKAARYVAVLAVVFRF